MQCKRTLDDIRQEASLLEFDVLVHPDGFLQITKRGNSSLFYQSLLPLDDPRTLSDAWSWLQDCRASFDQLDQARARAAARGRHTRQGNPFITALFAGLFFVVHFLPCQRYAERT